jgi:anti-sigma factor RsiW
MIMTRDQLEFAISQYIDGTLPPLETTALEERLATDAEARALLAEYRQLDDALETSLAGVPAVAWDRFAQHLSDAVAQEEPPLRHYSLVAWRRAAAVALAACVALVCGIAFLSYRVGSSDATAQGLSGAQPVVLVIGPQVEQAPQTQTVAQVAVGPAPTMTDSWRYAETIISRPAVVMIDRASRPAQDSDSGLY